MKKSHNISQQSVGFDKKICYTWTHNPQRGDTQMETTKDRILNAFWKLAEQNSLYSIKVKHVTDLAACNRCTFYQYFNDIYDLLDFAEDDLLQKIQNSIEHAYSPDISHQQMLHIAAASFHQYGKYLALLFGPNGSPSFQMKYKKALRPIVSRLIQSSGHTDNEFLCEYITGAFISTVCYWYEHPDIMTVNELVSMIYQLMTEGFIPKHE